MRRQKIFVVLICLFVGALHFVIGPAYKGPFTAFVSGYLIDILLPFCVYFLIKITNVFEKRWKVGLIVMLIGFSVETLQYFGVPVFGNTFDPVDYLMYTLGVGLAYFIDLIYFTKLDK